MHQGRGSARHEPVPGAPRAREEPPVTGNYFSTDLAELFTVSRPTAYRTLNLRQPPQRAILPHLEGIPAI